jgi:hypothetical protein
MSRSKTLLQRAPRPGATKQLGRIKLIEFKITQQANRASVHIMLTRGGEAAAPAGGVITRLGETKSKTAAGTERS